MGKCNQLACHSGHRRCQGPPEICPNWDPLAGPSTADIRPVIINLWAPPGIGKSSNMAAIFNILKYRGLRAEMTPEIAKLYSYEENAVPLREQFNVTAQQEYRHFMLIGKVDYIVSDCPNGLGLLFCEERDEDTLFDLCRHYRNRYLNLDVRLMRDPKRPYQQYGRWQTEEQSKALEAKLDTIIEELTDNCFARLADNTAAAEIVAWVEQEVIRHGRH